MEADAHESFMVWRELTKRDKRSSAHRAAQTFGSIKCLLKGMNAICA